MTEIQGTGSPGTTALQGGRVLVNGTVGVFEDVADARTSASAAERDLGFHVTTGFDEGLCQLVEWWRTLRGKVAAGRQLTTTAPAVR